jgi:hypothetical protein
MEILDPTDERVAVKRSLTVRTGEIKGRLALLDISKPRGDVLIDQLEERLSARLAGVKIRKFRKPTFTKPAPDELRRKILEESDFVIEALAD